MAVKKKTAVKKIRSTVKKRIYAYSERSQKMIDEMLVKINPALQEKINNLVSVLENSREGKLGDLSFLAGKILFRAQEISKNLKILRKTTKKSSKKKRK
jgi:hypothetical protein